MTPEEDMIRAQITDVLQIMNPGLEVKFAAEFDLDAADMHDFGLALDKMRRRLTSKWVAWFWRWWYRPKPWDIDD